MAERPLAAPRCAALVGPYLTGKTTLFESLLAATGAIGRKGTVKDGNTVGDSAAEARARKMSVEVSAASAEYLGERWTFLDCPGSVELAQETQNALQVADVAVIVCEAETGKALMLSPLFKFLDDRKIPHMLFVNKMDSADYRVREVLSALQTVSTRPLVLRQVPLRSTDKTGQEIVTGYVDLVSERAYGYKPGQPSDLIKMPEEAAPREQEARRTLLESLADYDDKLLEQLLEDAVPSKDEIYRQLSKDLADDLIVPVFLGAAERDHGVRRLLKALRHEVPGPAATAARLGLQAEANDTVVQVFKTYHLAHSGKLSLARVLSGKVAEGMNLSGVRVGGVARPKGHEMTKLPNAGTGEVVALARMEDIGTGRLLSASGKAKPAHPWPAPLSPLFSLALAVENRNDEVKLTAALTKLVDEDPSLSVTHEAETHEMVLWGQGEIHLLIAADRLRLKYGLPVKTRRPQVKYKETIRRSVDQHARFKRQSGGHGQFADIARHHPSAGARQRFRLPRRNRRRIDPAPVHSLGRGWLARLSQPRAARFSRGRCFRGADRRAVPHGGQLRHGVQDRGQDGDERRHAEMRSRAARAHLQRDHRRSQRVHRAGPRPDQRPARPYPGICRQGGLARLGRGPGPHASIGAP